MTLDIGPTELQPPDVTSLMYGPNEVLIRHPESRYEGKSVVLVIFCSIERTTNKTFPDAISMDRPYEDGGSVRDTEDATCSIVVWFAASMRMSDPAELRKHDGCKAARRMTSSIPNLFCNSTESTIRRGFGIRPNMVASCRTYKLLGHQPISCMMPIRRVKRK